MRMTNEQATQPLPEYATLTAVFGGVLGASSYSRTGGFPSGSAGAMSRASASRATRWGVSSPRIEWRSSCAPVHATKRRPSQSRRAGRGRSASSSRVPTASASGFAAGFSYGLVLFPRETRFVTALFSAQAIADFLNAGYVKTRDS